MECLVLSIRAKDSEFLDKASVAQEFIARLAVHLFSGSDRFRRAIGCTLGLSGSVAYSACIPCEWMQTCWGWKGGNNAHPWIARQNQTPASCSMHHFVFRSRPSFVSQVSRHYQQTSDEGLSSSTGHCSGQLLSNLRFPHSLIGVPRHLAELIWSEELEIQSWRSPWGLRSWSWYVMVDPCWSK